MRSQVKVVQEYRAMLNELAQIIDQPKHPLLQKFWMGWLTPGSEILRRMMREEICPRSLLRTPQSLHLKWFAELCDFNKGRWISLLRPLCKHGDLEKILQLSKRRLQQLQQKAKCVSPGALSSVRETPDPHADCP